MQSNAAGHAVDMASRYRAVGYAPLSLVVRAHVHQMSDSGLSLINPTRYVTLPPLQMKNSYAHKVSANQPVYTCKLGGMAAVFFPQGGYVLHAFTRLPERPEPVVVVA